ncbi:hypothetical protein HS088_TW16G00326 [Tripterygium wilfordii]|uniref:Dof zinc finger protein n=1 Tax=Tripterygium wilfordii TaxID=458696 RepID=A0A7J7CIK1_TRIWF|nr:hypothetical protein HS088_TW16G00326 [Tripterygium wilfordii]
MLPARLLLIAPRCASPNTKFCYYNNYSLSQPRYFCKGCRRISSSGEELRDETTETSGSSYSLNQDHNRSSENHVAIECQDYPATGLIGEPNSIEKALPHQEILAENHGFGLLGVVEEVSQDALWSDDHAITLPQFTWQSTEQSPEFDAVFPDHDQYLKIPADLISDGWSSFNLPMLDNQNTTPTLLNWS